MGKPRPRSMARAKKTGQQDRVSAIKAIYRRARPEMLANGAVDRVLAAFAKIGEAQPWRQSTQYTGAQWLRFRPLRDVFATPPENTNPAGLGGLTTRHGRSTPRNPRAANRGESGVSGKGPVSGCAATAAEPPRTAPSASAFYRRTKRVYNNIVDRDLNDQRRRSGRGRLKMAIRSLAKRYSIGFRTAHGLFRAGWVEDGGVLRPGGAWPSSGAGGEAR